MQCTHPSCHRKCFRFPQYLRPFLSLIILACSTPAGFASTYQLREQLSEPLEHKDLPTLTTTIQLRKPANTSDELVRDNYTEAETAELRATLFDRDGNAIRDFVGEFQDVTPDGQGIITYSQSEAQADNDQATPTHLYRPDGVEVASLKGIFQGFTDDGQLIMTYLQGQSYLYTLDGAEQAVLEGIVRWSTLDGQILVTDMGYPEQFRLYSLEGVVKA